MSDATNNATNDEVVLEHPEPDAAWEQAVRDALSDRAPDDVLERSLALFDLASIDAELATLIDAELATLIDAESADVELAGVRSTVTVTTFTFVAGVFTIELEYDGTALSGQLFPAAAAELDLMNGMGDRRRIAANSVGAFEIASVIRGSWCLLVRTAADVTVRTSWFTL